MYITNVDEVSPILRARLRDYLSLKLGIDPNAKRLKCFAHDDSDPSMYFNPKTGEQTVRCFSCGFSGDIFAAASQIEGLPMQGPEWITVTIPHLAELLKIPIQTGEASTLDKERLKLFRLAQDISDILASSNANKEYLQARRWLTDELIISSISEEELITKLLSKGWTAIDVDMSLMVRTTNHHFFGEDKATFVIKDYRGRPIAFQSRNIAPQGMKYINTPETPIYEKRKALLGIDVAMRHGNAKQKGLYVVEGPGDLAQLYRVGVFNAVASCGTAFTAEHAAILKMLGIHTIYFSLDWDAAGILATQRILKTELGQAGIKCWVVTAPIGKNQNGEPFGDVDELLKIEDSPAKYLELSVISGFEWLMKNISDNQSPQEICSELIPIIAAEPTAIQRELFCKVLSEYVHISMQSIQADVETLRSGCMAERKERLLGAAQIYVRNVERDPENVIAAITQHEDDIENIEKDYKRETIGINYQLARYDALQNRRSRQMQGENLMGFEMRHLTFFREAMSGGMDWTTGALIYVGGRANSGKTATVIAIATDIALSDPNTIVVAHFTDDSYEQVEPRLKATIAEQLREDEPKLTIGMANNPHNNCRTKSESEAYFRADEKFRDLISSEKLIIIDMEDGSTLGTLEKNLRYVRSRYPEKKLFVVCDNTHNYRDFPHLEPMGRMTLISTQQKTLAAKYHCCLMATVEYRKNMPFDTTKIRLPVDDDIADARALIYRPSMILHVYNDLHDRKEAAEIFWIDPATPELKQPRLTVIFSKNKISAFKEKLVMDIDIQSVTIRQKSKEEAYREYERFIRAKEAAESEDDDERSIYIKSDYKKE